MTTTRTSKRVTCTIETTCTMAVFRDSMISDFSDGLMSVFVKVGRKKNMSNVLYHCTVIVGMHNNLRLPQMLFEVENEYSNT